MDKILDDHYSCFNVAVVAEDGTSHPHIVQRPSTFSEGLFGRFTRGYVALDVATSQLVFLKDYWRPLDATRQPETEIYADLQASTIPHLPRLRHGGDVSTYSDHHQATLTRKWANADGVFRSKGLSGYQHHRIIQDLAYSLSSATSSRELVAAVRNALECKWRYLMTIEVVLTFCRCSSSPSGRMVAQGRQ